MPYKAEGIRILYTRLRGDYFNGDRIWKSK